MKRNRVLIWLCTLITLGSGLVNLASIMDPALPERSALLREVFPVEFQHASRFLTLLIGFALVLSSINIYKRKKRAFEIVLPLSAASVMFHLTKGLDYEEALLSLALALLLLLARESFTVRSSVPDFRSELMRLLLAAGVAFLYGVAGFWFLDQREFGMSFTLSDSLHRMWLFVSLAGDPQLVPRTRHARWFLDSLSLMTVTAVAYSLFAFFRPVLYQFRTLPRERAQASEILKQYGRSSLDFFKVWPDKSYFFGPSQEAFIAYRVGGSFALALGDPVGAEGRIEETVRGFAAFCEENDWGIGFHQTLPDFLPIYRGLGFRKLKIGDEAVVDLTRFTLEGKGMKSLRNKVNQLEEAGIRGAQYVPPIPDDVLSQVKTVSDEWLKIPGRRERTFTLGTFDPTYVRSTPVFVAAGRNGQVLAFVNIIPSYVQGETTIDLMRRRTEAPNGIMDFLFVKVFHQQKEAGFRRFSLGMAPMAGFQEKEDASPEERAVHFFFQHLNFIFSYTGLRHYKAKFASIWEPRYAIYRNPLDLPRLALALGRVSEIRDRG